MAEEADLLLTAGFSDAQLVREANRVVALYKKKGEEAQKAFTDAQGKVTNTQAARAHVRELDRLSKAYDPVYRAAKQYENELKRLDRALDIGAISQKQYTAQVEQAALALRRVQNPMAGIDKQSRSFGGSLQQVGYQVGDFAVQVGAGTSATQALGQQLPQLLGAFGTYGALAGAAAAITIPLGAALIKAALDAETLEDATKNLTESTDAFVDAAEAASMPIDDLRIKYGSLADEIARANSVMAGLTAIQARFDLINTSQRLGSGLGFDLTPTPFEKADLTPDQAQLNQRAQEKAMDRLRRITGATAEQFEKLRMAINRTDTSNSIEAVVKDAENLLSVIAELSSNDGADREMLFGWAQQVEAVLRQAERQVENSVDEQTRTYNRIIEEFDKDTQQFKALLADRATAQKALDEAVKTGTDAQIAQWKRVIAAQDEQIAKAYEQAQKNDEAFQRIAKSFGAVEGGIKSYSQALDSLFPAANKGILDLIGQAEGTDKGRSYNETLGYGAYTGGAVNLTSMSLRDVLALQKQILDHPNNPYNSSAVGRYQIVSKTLRSLIGELNLSLDEQFTPELQDRLALQLVRRRQGQGTAGLRNEWEGLRNVPDASIMSALGQQVIPSADPEVSKALKEQIKERERLADQAKKYGEQLSTNLLTQQQTAELERLRSEQIAAIKAQGLGEDEEARAISGVNAEIEKQRTVLSLLAEAKKRNVDLDTLLANGSMTYRQAIEALGEAKRQDIIATNERAIAEGKAGQAQQFWKQQQEQTKNGLLDAIVAGESFADVLENLAQHFAKAALQAALFNEGPWAMGGSGGGLLSGIGDLVSGWFGGFRAGGGSVSHGRAYVVGETEPELFVPNVSGTVLNSRQIERAMGAAPREGRNSQYSLAMTLDLRGTTGDKALDQKLKANAQHILAQVPHAMREFELNGV
ncbi:lysozyme family protein [Paracoccus onubensis]|uniref:Bacteriophage tail tape measure N-terminal domain-containing protein n=1 Tax=Paracoccus onubensis TaxID=1675788 RepID=A0A418T443_9RHOB|nr:hypothetical protein [Paracoccus onubensis]RJE87956.1 hypothetical protein D3P04_03280 [Paracoccus onubensis]